MTPDPSGAARAPQTTDELVAEVKTALQQATKPRPRIHSHGYSPANNCEECRWLDAQNVIQKNGLEWLGSLVQAVEDQQGKINRMAEQRKEFQADRAKVFALLGLNPDGRTASQALGWELADASWLAALREKRAYEVLDETADALAESNDRLSAEVAQLRADGQRLRDLLGESAERINRARLTLGVAERTEELWLQARRETAEAEVLIRIALEKDAP